MPDFIALALQFVLWAVVAMSVLGMTVVPLSLFVGVLLARRKAKKDQR